MPECPDCRRISVALEQAVDLMEQSAAQHTAGGSPASAAAIEWCMERVLLALLAVSSPQEKTNAN